MFSILVRPVVAACILAVMAVLAGNGLLSVLKLKKSVSAAYFGGWLLIWAMTQLVAVPLVLAKKSFTMTFWIITVLVAMWCLYGLYECRIVRFRRPELKPLEWTGVVVTILCVLGLLWVNLVTRRGDADDSRFVVNAVDILRTDTMFLMNPATGEALETWQGELVKDVTAPWAVFIAWCAKLTGLNAAVTAHTTLPPLLILGVISVWWLLSESFFKKERFYRCLFIDLAILVTVYGGYSVYTEQVFMLGRIWQGKAAVASLGIPAAYLAGCWLYQNSQPWGYYVLPVVLNLAMCLMSGMGLAIGAVMFVCIGLICGIAKRDWKRCLACWAGCIPNVVYFLLNSSLG